MTDKHDIKDIKISVIIPVYNVEKYVRDCADSIIKQDPYEVILVDDGSTDNSGAICDEYAREYERIKVIHKENGGLSDARNAGISEATGDYLVFADSDDYIGECSFSALKKCIDEQGCPDVLLMRYFKIRPDNSTAYADGELDYQKLNNQYETALSYIASLDKYPASACKKCVKRELILDNEIYFKVGQLSEDYEWTLKLFLSAKTFGCCNEYRYFYRIGREGSITNTVGSKHVQMLLDIIEIFVITAEKQSSETIRNCVYSFAAFIYRVTLYQGVKFYKMNRERIDSYSYLLKYRQSRDIRIIRFFTKTVGIRNTVKLLDVYKGNWRNAKNSRHGKNR